MPAPESTLDPKRLRRRRRKQRRRRVSAFLLRGALGAYSRLPREVARGVGGALGLMAHRLLAKDRRRATEQIATALGEGGDAPAVVRRMYRHFGETFADILVMQRHGPEWVDRNIEVHGWEEAAAKYDEVLAEGNGLIALTGHFGNWELFACLGSRQWPQRVTCVARRNSFEGYDRMVAELRERMGVALLYQDESARGAVRVLRENGLLGVLPDQDVKRVHGVFVDFFGRPAYTPSAPASLCHRVGSPIVPLFVVREGDAYRAKVHEPIRREEFADAEDPVAAITRRWTEALESEIRDAPEQWVWFHERWRTTPEIVERRQAGERLANVTPARS